MRNTFTLLAFLATIIVACTSEPKHSYWIHVEGNKFIDANGKEIIFRGLCYSDPVKLINDNQWNEKYFAEAAQWGANIVRFAVHPTHLNKYGWDETFKAMDEGIEWAKKYKLY